MNPLLIQSILSCCTFPNFKFLVFDKDGVSYLQVEHTGPCNVTGKPMTWKGRKWMLSNHMVKSEIVHTAFLAIMTAIEHETREQFHYNGRAIFGPHFNVDRLHGLTEDPNALDERPPLKVDEETGSRG